MLRPYFALLLILALISPALSIPLTTADTNNFSLDELYNENSPTRYEGSFSIDKANVTSSIEESTIENATPANIETLNSTAPATIETLNGTAPATTETLSSTAPTTTNKAVNSTSPVDLNSTTPTTDEDLDSTEPANDDGTAPATNIEFVEPPETADDSDVDEDGSRLINNPFLRYNIEHLVSTSNLFGHLEDGHKKVKVLVLPKGKAFHIVYKVLVFPKGKKGVPKLYKLIIIPGKTKGNQKELKFIVIPKDNPGAWKEYNVVIPYKH